MKPENITVLPPTHDLDAARGVLLGLAISAVLWIALFTVVSWK